MLWNPTFKGQVEKDDFPPNETKHNYSCKVGGEVSRERKFEGMGGRHDESCSKESEVGEKFALRHCR